MILLIKQCGHVYMHVTFVLTFCLFVCFLVVFCKQFLCFFRIDNCVCKSDKNENEHLLKKKEKKIINWQLSNHLSESAMTS